MIQRRLSNQVYVGDVPIGGDAPVSIQSMTNTDPHDFSATYRQIKALEEAGCQIIRLTLPDTEAVETVRRLKKTDIKIPLVGDIHFDYRIALEAAGAGIDKIRINPGNIGAEERVKAVATACKERHIPIRIGVNSGSLEKDILAKYGSPTAEALAESALYHASLLEKCDFGDIVISVKASNVKGMIEANRILAKKTSYPLHLGVTEAGGAEAGTVKSAVGIGTMLAEGIGDTVRVSLTADPLLEVVKAKAILAALDMLPQKEMNIISCPTCGRTKIDLIPLLSAFEAEAEKQNLKKLPVTVAFMGCVVNGPGEAREADIGVAGGKGEGLLFRRGEIIGKVAEEQIVPSLIQEIKRMFSE